jgi:guanosine-3',5'-bis(diphosphate) 3'-pyrophosphohydrolase
MNEWVSVWRAADAAARWHVHQRRKGAANEPYINHLLEVSNLVTQATDGSEPNVVIAALLHDAIEDQGITPEAIASEFGQRVADIILEVTDNKSLPKAERKRRQVESAPHKSREAKLIKLADKISNVRAIANSPAPDWSIERRLEYVKWAKDVVAGLRGTSLWLERQFDEVIEQAQNVLSNRMKRNEDPRSHVDHQQIDGGA